MKVTLLNVTPNAEDHIVEVARVSSSRKNKKDKPEGLLRYLVQHKHWSPFEHGHATFEIETSKAIGIQLIRHRSFSFQEFSQRYQDVNRLGDIFEPIELRSQCEDNRQSSVEVIDPKIVVEGGSLLASDMVGSFLNNAHKL
jgi:thymidylate synthase (FAD)